MDGARLVQPQELKQIRINLKLSQSKMAEYIGIKSDRTIRAWESGERVIPIWAIKIIKAEEQDK